MSLQTENLSMTALGVRGDKPANPSQPPLADGIHLRWGFDRDLGFPWRGFYLFRRLARPGRPLCVSAVSGGLTKGAWPEKRYHTAIGVLSSSDNLVLTEDFTPNAQVEFALGGRKYLRFDLPAGELARRFELRIGFRPACLAAESLIAPETVKAPGALVYRQSPLTLQGATFRVASSTGSTTGSTMQFALVNTNAGQLVGLGCGYGLTLTLAASNNVELLLTRVINSPSAVEYFDANNKSLGTIQLSSPVGQTETIRLSGQNLTRVEVRTIRNVAYLHRVCADGLAAESTVKVTAYAGTTLVQSLNVSGRPGQIVSAAIEDDALTTLEVGPGSAALVDLCYVPVAQDATQGWETIRGMQYPLGLPVTQPDYPCSVPNPQSLVEQRRRYPPPPGWVPPGAQGTQDSFTQLHAQLVELVKGGAAAAPMADRVFNAPPPVSSPPDPDPPNLSTFYILDMILLGALHPALAQSVGLYWVDEAAALDTAYDYLIVADHAGVGQLDAGKMLGVIQTSGFAEIDAYICFNKRAGPVPPLPPPTGLKTFVLPGGTFANADGQLPQASNNAGLVWDLGWDDSSDLAADGAVMYLVWRAYLGDVPIPSSIGTHVLVTKVPPDKPRPIVVTEARLPNGLAPQRSPDWPPFPLHFIDRNLADGWYSYQVSGVDLFGRYSVNSTPASVRLRDTIAPPAVGIEATALDPEDPFVQQDDAYQKWRQSLDPSVRNTLVGLRARWVWPAEYQRQAPDTAEFRLYFHPGAALPNASDVAVNWQERYHVINYAANVTVNTSNGDRTYELFLPPAGTKSLADAFPLNPTLTEPVVYAHVAVTAADAKLHTADQRVTGKLSNRPGNESPVGAPARIYRVWRKPPPAPEPAMNAGRYYASPADYHSRSFFTSRWKPQPPFKLHVFRALDHAIFKANWSQRQLTQKLDPLKPELFPPGWNMGLRQKVALELNTLRALVKLEADAGKALAFYRQLSDAALRVLASSPTVESAFVQLTINPLGPDDADAKRVGPDYPDGAGLDAGELTFIDTLDGRTANRYFYRAAFVDGAHNLGPLGPSSPPVYLPKVTPPVSPVLTRISGGERRIELRWVKGGEPNLSAYRVYRAADADGARDIRKMERVKELPLAGLVVKDNEVSWADETVPPGKDFFYRLTALDSEPAPNESAPSKVLLGRAVDTVPPQAPEWLSAEWVLYDPATSSTQPWPASDADSVSTPYRAAVRLALKTSADLCTVYRRAEGEKTWHAVNAAHAPAHGQLLAFDLGATPGLKLYYRAAAANLLGVTSPYSPVLVVEAE